jgi:hypothetical protein
MSTVGMGDGFIQPLYQKRRLDDFAFAFFQNCYYPRGKSRERLIAKEGWGERFP